MTIPNNNTNTDPDKLVSSVTAATETVCDVVNGGAELLAGAVKSAKEAVTCASEGLKRATGTAVEDVSHAAKASEKVKKTTN